MQSIIRDISLAPEGRLKINWVREHMPVLAEILNAYGAEKPFKGLKAAVSIHLEAKSAYLSEMLNMLGAEVYATGSNPLSTQDDVAAALSESGVTVFAKHGCTAEEYEQYLIAALSVKPDIIIDDGGDLVNILHETHPEYAVNLIGGCEETTTGIIRLRAREREGRLNFPMMNVNDGDCKHLFDNRYGTGQSVWDGINRTTNLIVAGKRVVVAGYGFCGKGVALRARALGAEVIVTEVDSVKAIEAVMDGYTVMPMAEAAPLGDFFITVTGCKDVIGKEIFPLLKDGALLSNAGHFDVEVNAQALKEYAVSVKRVRNNIEECALPNGKRVYLLAEGRLVNLAAGDGHPAEIMDMSFALQILCAKFLSDNRGKLENKLYSVPREVDKFVAAVKLRALGMKIDSLSPEQAEYLNSFNV
ncbi:MAG: adenosylhomocysteinase [Eubacteriales bacterium]|nr:adenosylhomocysteinase [Eubacteriales bacterium]MDD3883119.1 adenosylhomocysteinase [Eubacteriales bacterium]MDD4513311.1 adenosylhomocysteinase [Eubacteriales bacterium]